MTESKWYKRTIKDQHKKQICLLSSHPFLSFYRYTVA